MEPFSHLLSADDRDTLQFFFSGLREVAGAPVDDPPLLYNASILAHFASTSTSTASGMPTPASLLDVFDRFVLGAAEPLDAETRESAAAQCLVLTGFFADQMRARFNLSWYVALGAAFFEQAAAVSRHPAHQRMMLRMAEEFPYWRDVHWRLARELRDSKYLL